MKRHACAVLLFALPLAGACDLTRLIQGDVVFVKLINDGAYPVEVELRISGNQYELQGVLEEFGDELNYTVDPGETVTFSESCDDLQAIMIANAELSLAGDLGPSNKTGILRDGGEFGCGDTIIYTFDHPAVPTSLEIDEDIMG
jgi:hypothetical protein